MKSDITKGIYVSVQGEDGRTNGIPWEVLKKMGDSLQSLILDLATFNLEGVTKPDPKDYVLELFDFQPGSAIQAFRIR